MKLSRHFTQPAVDPLDAIEYDKRRSVITNPDGSIVFEAKDAEIPRGWSQLATDILVSKYFRRAGLPGPVGRETSSRQVFHRIVHSIRGFGEQKGYFDSAQDADTFEAELKHILAFQLGAFNSPVWFNCGLWHEYGISSSSGGNYAWDFESHDIAEIANNYERPQCSACFIQAVSDDLMSIFDLAKTEARIFKYGSGTGTNFSKLRSRWEKLSGGGTSSGLMSFLEVFDRGAGATKSGGTTRRAAKMVCLDMDHPEIVDFINWKVKEEDKARCLIESMGLPSDFNGEAYKTVSGQNSNNSVRVSDEFMQAALAGKEWGTYARTTGELLERYDAADLLGQICRAAWRCADPGVQFDTTINDWHTCPNTDKIRASNPCVTGDTLVATDEGWQRIDALVGRSARIIGADGQPHFVTQIFPTGRKPVFLLTTRSGYQLRITADHRVLTRERGDVAVSDLHPGEHLYLQGAGFGRRALSDKLATAIGLAVGDGCLSTSQTRSGEEEILTLVMASEEAGVLARVAGEVNEQKQLLRAVGGPGNPAPVNVSTGAVSRLSFASRPVVALFKEFAVLDEGSEGKRFTPAAFELDRPSLAGLLRGLFTADGTVADYGDKSQYVSLDSSSSDLLRQVQTMLLSFGIKSKLYTGRRGETTETLMPDGRGGMKIYPVRPMFSLRISRSSRIIFEREIGFDPASLKADALANVNARIGAYRDEMTDAVASITPLGDEDVFDLTEEVTNHFCANGLIVHNCSEYMFLDDSACNLASINLLKFIDENGTFDVAAFRHTVRLFLLAQEILVDFSSYPTAPIARNSHDYRPLGLGYANLGALLMVLGIPYDSPEGRAMCGAITSLMTGHAYRVSAEIAERTGPFEGYARNARPFMRVMRKHRDACDNISAEFCPSYLLAAARTAWEEAIDLGERVGYRNAQVTVLAPTGTIGLLMDCDTTGIEPDYALVKFKKLAGGGYFKIINQCVPQALRHLGYDSNEIEHILQFIGGTGSFRGAPHVDEVALKSHGFTDDDIARVEKGLRGVMDLPQAFHPALLGDDLLARLGLAAQAAVPGFSALRALGFTDAQIDAASDHVCGRMTIEGAPQLREEHLPVFDCANRCGRNGRRFIDPMGHVRMMAAAQPFISGAISKTVNLPGEATVDEIRQIYVEGWRLGLKAIALYRDGCKMSQPLTAKGDSAKKQQKAADLFDEAVREAEQAAPQTVTIKVPTPMRRRPPARRRGFTIESRVGGQKVYLRTGEHEDGTLGEIFIDMHKEGAAFRSMMNCFAIAVSKGLQYGVPLKEFVDTFTFTRFEPQGPVDHPNIKFATSVIDFIFRVLALEYLHDATYCQNKPKDPESSVLVTDSTHEMESLLEVRIENPLPVANPAPVASAQPARAATGLESQMSGLMGDAPFCDVCGHITVRNGTCYKCLNCGNSMGCS